MGVRPSWSTRSPVRARQIIPPAFRIMKFTISGVTSCAAQMRSPSFSRSSSSATMTNRPSRMDSMACSTVPNGIGKLVGRRRALPVGIRSDQSLYVFPDHVRLDVHPVAMVKRVQRRMTERVVDERELHDVRSGEVVHCQAHAIHGNG